MNIHLIIKFVRQSAGISQKQLAKDINVTPTYISMIESSQKTPSLDVCIKLSERLDIPLPLLFVDTVVNCEEKTIYRQLQTMLSDFLVTTMKNQRVKQ